MANSSYKRDPWDLPAFLLWTIFLIVGLIPHPIYLTLRHLGAVTTQRALVNSPYAVTVAFAFYIALFCWNRCRQSGLTPGQAQDRAAQVGVLGLIAFLPFDYPSIIHAYVNPLVQDRALIFLVGAAKTAAWVYIGMLLVLHYVLGVTNAFAAIPSLFPSTRRGDRQDAEQPPEQQ